MGFVGFWGTCLFLGMTAVAFGRPDCYWQLQLLRKQKISSPSEFVVPSYGSETPIARAFEKEGRHFPDISPWWDRVDFDHAKRVLERRLRDEKAGTKPSSLRSFLNNLLSPEDKFVPKKFRDRFTPSAWKRLSDEEKLAFLLETGDLKSRLTLTGFAEIFYLELIKFDRLEATSLRPQFLTLKDDMGSYEVVHQGAVDRTKYQGERKVVEDMLDGHVGHQHLVHDWPSDAGQRSRIAPQYIELLDATTWFLFWRSTNRDPEDYEAVIWHEFLGVYHRRALERLYHTVEKGDAEDFQDKYRMVGARGFRGRADMQGQDPSRYYPDWEMRSGNKGIKRDFVEDVLEARLSTGDYSGLRDFRTYEFDAAAPIREVAFYLDPEDQAVLEAFSAAIPKEKSDNRNYSFDVRNKIFAPLLPWSERIPIEYNLKNLRQAQFEYATALVEVAHDYLIRKQRTTRPESLESLWDETKEEIESLVFEFADKTDIARAFERYLAPKPKAFPSILVANSGPIDVNAINLGIEFSFRFPESPTSRDEAEDRIAETAMNLADALGAVKVEGAEDHEGHGHGLGVKYWFTDKKGQKWRVEWDGIQRYYRKGTAVWPKGGHAEIPSPKASPQDIEEVKKLYQVNRDLGQDPRRGAGGAHINVDLEPFQKLPGNEGPRKFVNFLNFFEAHRHMIQFLWQHPFRVRVAAPVEMGPDLEQKLTDFDGSWDDLGRLLYEQRYFNPYVGRKPGYTQLNATAIISPLVPDEYHETIDIKDPETEWFPAFGGKGRDRVEFRLFDAAPDEYLAALQIKYVRALLNKSLNSPGNIPVSRRYSDQDFKNWREDGGAFLVAAEEHLTELGLDASEFLPALVDAHRTQQAVPSAKTPPKKYDKFKPLTPKP